MWIIWKRRVFNWNFERILTVNSRFSNNLTFLKSKQNIYDFTNVIQQYIFENYSKITSNNLLYSSKSTTKMNPLDTYLKVKTNKLFQIFNLSKDFVSLSKIISVISWKLWKFDIISSIIRKSSNKKFNSRCFREI